MANAAEKKATDTLEPNFAEEIMKPEARHELLVVLIILALLILALVGLAPGFLWS